MSTKDDGRIKPLSDHVASKITSSASITTLNSVVLALLANALDAGSRRIEVLVDPDRGSCTVSDDGLGIHPADFQPSAGLGKSYYTSKTDKLGAVHGSSGTFLASLSALSFLSITSKHHGHRSTNRITFHRSQTVSRLIPVPDPYELRFHEHGTTVTVRDLFGNMPVRVKHRSLRQQEPLEQERQLDELKLSILALLAPWHEPVSLKLTLSRHERTEMVLNLAGPRDDHGNATPTLRSTSATKLNTLLVQSGYLHKSSWQAWIPASASSSIVSVRGMIGLKPWPTRQLQFISIGIQPLLQQLGSNEIYDVINKMFKQSDFGSQHDDKQASENSATPQAIAKSIQTPRPRDLKASRKGVEKWPMFILIISLKEDSRLESDAMLRSPDNLEKVLHVVQALVTEWLSIHHFRTRIRTPSKAPGKDKQLEGKSLRIRSPLAHRTNSPLSSHRIQGSGSRTIHAIESSLVPTLDGDTGRHQQLECPTRFAASPILRGQFNKSPINDSSEQRAESCLDSRLESEDKTSKPSPNGEVLWRDPVSNQMHKVDARTGFAVQHFSPTNSRSGSGRRLTMRPDSHKNSGPASGWLHDILHNWENPVFITTEKGISRVSHETSGLHSQSLAGYNVFKGHEPLDGISLPTRNKLSKESLRNARFVAQVDDQFILVVLPSNAEEKQNSDVLVAVDQHAADERCILENLYDEFCPPVDQQPKLSSDYGSVKLGVHGSELSTPIVFKVPVKEIRYFRLQMSKFADWGIIYYLDDESARDWQDEAQLIVKALPAVIADRCMQEPKVLISLLRSELWKTVEHGENTILSTQSAEKSTSVGPNRWIRWIGKCPSGILDLLNSKACRSAIMFNDKLTAAQCIDLISRLSQCVFPFQCAHGRPTMVPLIHLGSQAPTHMTEVSMSASAFVGQDAQKSYVDAYRSWKDLGST